MEIRHYDIVTENSFLEFVSTSIENNGKKLAVNYLYKGFPYTITMDVTDDEYGISYARINNNNTTLISARITKK